MNHSVEKTNKIEYLKFAVVMIVITAVSAVGYKNGSSQDVAEFMRWFMGVFMVTFAGFKFVGYSMFAVMFAGYDIVAKKFPVYGKLFPFIQLGLGLLYLLDALPETREILVLVVTGLASIGVFKEVYKRKTGIHCACLGNIIKLPLSTVSFIEDVGMFVMATAMLLLA